MYSATTRSKRLLFLVGAIAGFAFAVSLLLSLGQIVLSTQPPEAQVRLAPPVLIAILVTLISCIGLCLAAIKRGFKQFGFGFTYTLLSLVFVAIVFEILASFFVVGWPNLGLHASFFNRQDTDGATSRNSWGQRDSERTVTKPAATRRYVFIGDSFLEDLPGSQLSSLVEKRLNANSEAGKVEVVNLGVSATAPDEYYWRTKNIARPLEPDVCVLFYFATNDLLLAHTLDSLWGVAAPYPRDSLLSQLGLLRLNHLLTFRMRPFWKAWFGSRDLAAYEADIHAKILETPDAQLPEYLASVAFPENHLKQRDLSAFLKEQELTDFYERLRDPPENRFRSTYLRLALQLAAGVAPPSGNRLAEAVQRTWVYVDGVRSQCNDAGAQFVMVVIPDASSVDTDFISFYSQLADLRPFFWQWNEAAALLTERMRSQGGAVLDLSGPLGNQPDTYLLCDGHWTRKGTGIVADAVADFLSTSRSRVASVRLRHQVREDSWSG